MKLPLCGYVVAGVLLVASGAQAADGQAVWDPNCAACHKMMAPKFGDKAAWAPLIKQGTDALVASVIKGKGAMPARGGKPTLSDADIKAAVEYAESKSQ
ncbi:MAG: cytochrome c5 family protein [Alphaproteobacteria bacterium]|nr:cytochrome c5 family protein [Alphaproteobacteria bacterium]